MLRPTKSGRSLLLLSSLMILVTVVAAAGLVADLRQRELAHAKGELVSQTRMLGEQTTRTVEGVALMMQGTKKRLSDEVGSQLDLDSLPVQLLLKARVSGLPQVKSIFVVDRGGVAVNSSRPDFIRGLEVADRKFFSHFANQGSDELFVSLPEKAHIDGQWVFYVSTPLVDPSGKFRGLLVASISIGYIESLYDSIGSDSASRIQLLNNEGMLLAGKPHDETRFGLAAAKLATLAELGQNSDGVVVAEEDVAEGRRFVAYRQVADYPLTIAAGVDEYEALIPWRHTARQIIAGVSLVLIFVVLATFIIVRNLRWQEALESALKEKDEQFRHMVQSSRDAIVNIDGGKRVVLFNQAAERMFGIPASEAIGSGLDEWLSRCLPQRQRTALQRYLQEGWQSSPGVGLLGVVELVRNEKKFPVEMSLSTTCFHGEILVTAVFRDLTERQRAEEELRASYRQIQDLSAALQDIREVERARIARELHDELGQLLTGIRMEVSWLGGRLGPEQRALADKVGSIKGQIDQTIVSVRRISSELWPLVLDDLGFAAAAGWYTNQFSVRTGLQVDLDLGAHDPEKDRAVATALFRVLQESLTNVARHAQATRVDVRLEQRGDEWILSVKDDGKGFAQNGLRNGGFGLIGMRERVHILGGRFSVVSAPGLGTSIDAIVPRNAKQRGNNEKMQSSAGG